MIERSYVDKLVTDLALEPGEEYPCPYLGEQGLKAQTIGFFAESIPPGYYHALMDLGFRRSGHYFYRPQCRSCAECRQIRLDVSRFQISRAQRRCLAQNADLEVVIKSPRPTEEKYELYRSYMGGRHQSDGQKDSYESFVDFLYLSPINTREVLYQLNGELIAVGIIDLEPEALSAVYCYFSPKYSRRSLGLFNMLWSVSHCQANKTPYYYMGYYIKDCQKMNYKSKIAPSELLCSDGSWQEADSSKDKSALD